MLIWYVRGVGAHPKKIRFIEERYLEKKKNVSRLGHKLDTTKTHVLAEFGANTIKTGVSGIFCMIFDAYSVRYLI
jgi:hypothetical protein